MTSWTKTAVFLGICLLAGTVSSFAEEAGPGPTPVD